MWIFGDGVQRRLFAHLSNLKPTDPTAPRTRGLWTPAQRRSCRAAGSVPVQRTQPSWSCCRRQRWTWAGRGATLAASPACSSRGRSRSGLQASRRWAPQTWICLLVTKGANTPRLVTTIVAARAGVIFRYSRSALPLRVALVSLGSKTLNFYIKLSQAISAGY